MSVKEISLANTVAPKAAKKRVKVEKQEDKTAQSENPEGETNDKKPGGRAGKIIIFVVLLLIAAAAAYYYMQYVKGEPTTTTEFVEAAEVETSAEQSSDSETDTLEVDTTATEVCSNVEATE